VVPAADLATAAVVAGLLWLLGVRFGGPAAGGVSAVIFLLLSDPSFARYGGVRVRAQCETFIALLVTAAVALSASGARSAPGAWSALGAGVLLGGAFALKYNAGLYALVVLFAFAMSGGVRVRQVLVTALGAVAIPLALLVVFWRGGALDDLYQSTIRYNVEYSGETYASRWAMV